MVRVRYVVRVSDEMSCVHFFTRCLRRQILPNRSKALLYTQWNQGEGEGKQAQFDGKLNTLETSIQWADPHLTDQNNGKQYNTPSLIHYSRIHT